MTYTEADFPRLRQVYQVHTNDINYPHFRILPDGNLACIVRLAFTWGLCLGGNEREMYRYRFCFPCLNDAVAALNWVQRVDDVPTFGWVASRPENRLLQQKELIAYVDDFAKLQAQESNEIERMIEEGLYTSTIFQKWQQENGEVLDEGAKRFLDYLKVKHHEIQS